MVYDSNDGKFKGMVYYPFTNMTIPLERAALISWGFTHCGPWGSCYAGWMPQPRISKLPAVFRKWRKTLHWKTAMYGKIEFTKLYLYLHMENFPFGVYHPSFNPIFLDGVMKYHQIGFV